MLAKIGNESSVKMPLDLVQEQIHALIQKMWQTEFKMVEMRNWGKLKWIDLFLPGWGCFEYTKGVHCDDCGWSTWAACTDNTISAPPSKTPALPNSWDILWSCCLLLQTVLISSSPPKTACALGTAQTVEPHPATLSLSQRAGMVAAAPSGSLWAGQCDYTAPGCNQCSPNSHR